MSADLKLTEAEWHRKQAVDLFNFTWTLIDKPDRTSADDDRMIRAAHASRYHWGSVGTVINYLRGDWQIAHVYTFLHQPQTAEAQQYQRLAEQAGDQIAEEEDRQLFQNDLAVGPWFDL